MPACCTNNQRIKRQKSRTVSGTLIPVITSIFCVIELLINILALVFAGFIISSKKFWARADGAKWLFGILMLCALLWLGMTIQCLIGIWKQRAGLVFPHIITSGLVFLIVFADTVMMILDGTGLDLVLMAIGLDLWILVSIRVEWRCFELLKDISDSASVHECAHLKTLDCDCEFQMTSFALSQGPLMR